MLTSIQLASAIALLEAPARRTSLLSTLETAARRIAACSRVILIGSAQDDLGDEEYGPLYLGNSSPLTAALLPLCKPEHLPKAGEVNLIARRAPLRSDLETEAPTVLLVGTHPGRAAMRLPLPGSTPTSAISIRWEHCVRGA
jgi:hypothetical protein